MRRHEFFADKVVEVQKALNRWAKRCGVIGGDEHIVILTRIESGNEYWKMSPEDFFSVARLVANGMPNHLAARVHNAIRLGNHYFSGDRMSPYGWVGNMKWKTVYKTMEEFLAYYRDVDQLFKRKNLGRLSVVGMVKLIRDSGMHIEDSQGLLG